MKRLYAVQVNYLYGQTVYLPYSVGVIIANAFSDSLIKSQCVFEKFFYTRQNVDEVVEEMSDPYMVVFSTYVWNFEYNLKLAERIKKAYPSCLIVFGGHQVSKDCAELLEKCGYIDYLIHEEGEIPFHDLLKATLESSDLSVVPNLSYRNASGNTVTNAVKCFDTIDFPSPYLEGFFDDIVKDERYEYSATLETNRGCPFSCSFCDWGTLRGAMRKASMDKVCAEIMWMCQNRISHVYCADSNFGIFKRDAEIVSFIINCKNETGYPDKFRACFSKESNDFVFYINKLLNDAGLSKGATLSFQSLDEQTMKNVGRSNMSIQKYNALLSKYNEYGIPTQTELIIALPGETYRSFVLGVCKLLKAGQHTSINIYNCEVFPNSQLAYPDTIEKFSIESIRTPAAKNHCDIHDDIEEYDSIICSTFSMTREDWTSANLFSYMIQSYHCLGLLQAYAIYLYYEQNVEYEEFYTDFLTWCLNNPNTISGQVLTDIDARLKQLLDGAGTWEYKNPLFGNTSWPFEEGIFLEMIARYDEFTCEMSDYIKQHYVIDRDVFVDLSEYQKNIVKVPGKSQKRMTLCYDFYGYFQNIYQNKYESLKKTNCHINIDNSYCADFSLAEYARQIVWYGRKGGKNIYSGAEMEIEYVE